MENGTLAALFWLWALLGSDGSFEREAADTAWMLGIGETILDREANGAELRVVYMRDHRFGPLQPTFDVSVTERGGAYLGSGFRQEAELWDGIWLTGHGVAGLWLDDLFGDDEDLGGVIEFRTGFALEAELGPGRFGVFPEGSRIAIGWDHRSNAGFGRINPGMEVLSLRYIASF